ncbi:MAG TPA: acylase [Burkholderiaceae bacterium]|nr:acylase [Burkholderiaceae bacterium]
MVRPSGTLCARALRALAVVAVAALAGCASTPSGPRSVEIERTTYGVAHIRANDYESLAYGVAYAHAQDNVCQTADHLVTVRGERSRYFGPAATGRLGLRVLPNEQIDLFIRSHMDDAKLVRAYSQMSREAQEMARGYVAGYDRYLGDTGLDKLPAACRNARWVQPMTMLEYFRLGEQQTVLGGAGAFADAIVAARPPAGTGSLDAPGDAVARAAPQSPATSSDESEAGSNGWAFGRDATTNGRGLLLGNPHFPWTGTNRFWQMHLTIPGELDVMGASTGHTAVVQIGFNHDVAWTHTVSTGKRFTLFELKLVPGDPTAYVVDDREMRMEPKPIDVEMLGTDGHITLRQHTFWTTVYGPVVVLPRLGLNWTTTTAYALKDATAGNARATDAWLAINRARNVQEIRAAIGNLGIPWVNTIAADRDGNAMYADVSVVPDVNADQLKRCAPSAPAARLFDAAGLTVLDGSRSACDWNLDTTSPVPGLTPPARMPVLIRSDWVQNSNDSYWLSHPGATPPGISPLVGPVDVPQRLRTRIGIDEIQRRLAGTDGLDGNRFGIASLQAVLMRDRNFAATLVLDDLLAACGDAPAAAHEACTALHGWDRTDNLDSTAAHLFREFWRRAKDVPNVWRVPFDPKDPVGTPSGLRMTDEAVRAKIWDALAGAAAESKKAGFALDAPLGKVQVKPTALGRIGVHGGDEFEGVLNKIETLPLGPQGLEPIYGTSYVQTVTFDDRGPVAEAFLTYGQSSDPDSPRAFDQLPAFSRKQWPKLPFHPQDVAAQRVGDVLKLMLP